MKPIAAILLLCAISLPAQVAKPKQPPAPAQTPAPAAAAPAKADAPPVPVVTDLQAAELQACDAKIEAAQARAEAQYTREVLPWQQKRQAVIAEELKANPGFQWHEAQGPQDFSRLIPIPKPAPPPPAPGIGQAPTPAVAK